MLVNIHNKEFNIFLHEEEIQKRVKDLARKINEDYTGKEELHFIVILNGSFMFAGDLLKHIIHKCTISFVRLSSYVGTKSSGAVQTILGLNESIENKNVIIIEDIVDTGNTLSDFLNLLPNYKALSVKICSLLLKPEALQHPIIVDYVGFEIPNEFVVGYGLDYNEYGRNLTAIYKVFTPNAEE